MKLLGLPHFDMLISNQFTTQQQMMLNFKKNEEL
jgi:hypothetical protein